MSDPEEERPDTAASQTSQTARTTRKELWELLDIPAGNEDFGKAFATLVDAAKTAGKAKDGIAASREQEEMMLSMISTCLSSIAENTNFVMRAKQEVASTKVELSGLKSSVAELSSKLDGVAHENAVLRAAAAGEPAPEPPAAAPVVVVDTGWKERLNQVEWTQRQHSEQLAQALEYIMEENASEEVVLAHFGDPADNAAEGLTAEQNAEMKQMIGQTSAICSRSLDVSLFEQSFGGQNFLKMCFDGWKDRVGKGEAEPTAAVAEEGVLEDQHISDETKGTIAEHCHDKVARKMKEHVDMDKLKQDVIVLQGQLTTAMADFSELKDQTAAAVAQQAAANATGQPVAAPAPAGMSQEQAKDMEEKAAAVDVKLAEHEEKLFATAEELKTVVEEADRARVVEESAAEDISFLKKEVEDIKSELKPVGNDARGAAASVTALNVQMGKTEQQVDKIQLGLEKTEAAVFATPAGLEPRVGQLELALRRLAGAVDIKEEMANQAKELVGLLAGKANQSEVEDGLARLQGMRPELDLALQEKSAEMVELLRMAKAEWQEGNVKMNKEVEAKADRDWLEKLEAQIRADVEKSSAGSIDEATLNARLDALRKAMEEAMANAKAKEPQGGSAAFRCIACDHPLPPPHEAKRQRKHFNLYQTLPAVTSLAGTDVQPGAVASSPGSQSFAPNRYTTPAATEADVVYRGGFPTVIRHPGVGGNIMYVSGMTRAAPVNGYTHRRSPHRDPREGGNSSPVLPPLDKSANRTSPVPSMVPAAVTGSAIGQKEFERQARATTDAISKVARGPLTLGTTAFGDIGMPPAAIPAYEPWGVARG